MSTAISTLRGNLSRVDFGILGLHGLAALVTGIIGFIQVDPDWAGLQRIVTAMLVGAWVGGIAIMALIASRLASRWARAAILLAGPFLGLAAIVAAVTLG